jgi:hypothetical protein
VHLLFNKILSKNKTTNCYLLNYKIKQIHSSIIEQVETTQTGLDIQGVQQIKGLINKCILEKIGKFIQIG